MEHDGTDHARRDIVDHDPEPALYVAIEKAQRSRLESVENSKQKVADEEAQEVPRGQPDRDQVANDLVDDDRAVIVLASEPRVFLR